MTLLRPFAGLDLNIHYICAVLLVPAALAQKYLVSRMRKNSPPASPAEGNAVPAASCPGATAAQFYRTNVHPNLGHAVVVLMAGMAYGGFQMRQASDFPAFQAAMLYFVAPWVIFIVGILATASYKLAVLHAVLGNLVVKACVAVPVARLLGTALQHLYASLGQPESVLSQGYYHGIIGSAVLTSVWAIVDIVLLYRNLANSAVAATKTPNTKTVSESTTKKSK